MSDWEDRLLTRRVWFEGEEYADPFAGREAEMAWYLRESVERYEYMLSLLAPLVVGGQQPTRILELGADPFFFTLLLKEHFGGRVEIVTAGRPPEVWPGEATGVEEKQVQVTVADRIYSFPHWVFNVERDSFPFAAGTFDLVICALVLEMLIYSPSHMVGEIHRVLRPGGKLLLNTANSLRIQRSIKLLLNRTIEFPYTGSSIYGRPNREYTVEELVTLLEGSNYQVERKALISFTKPNASAWERTGYGFLRLITALPLSYLANKRDQIFVVAKKFGEPKACYPDSLYQFRNSLPDDAKTRRY